MQEKCRLAKISRQGVVNRIQLRMLTVNPDKEEACLQNKTQIKRTHTNLHTLSFTRFQSMVLTPDMIQWHFDLTTKSMCYIGFDTLRQLFI